ncbi:hypothetical protein [Kutzneria kofuensis]|uniref:Guanylate cyclase domain-containing protein n=1 Tax=Kutzneria kofuensis TaxID=103725 RepID=A0A7W9KKQ7_9PSEU|nr:hypothetical protein [Kutzneria kofuensis]MBB5894108.1 hypothetical protein [Kutzneria kofuensis]
MPHRSLPPYRAMLVVDLKDFSGVPAAEQGVIGGRIPELLRDTFQRMGHGYLWAEAKFTDHTGDGYAMGFRTKHLPVLVDGFSSTLQQELADVGRRTGAPQRMRVSLSVGPLTDDAGPRIRDGQGAARIETHRLLDSAPVRDLLARSNPQVTLVATIISARVYEDVVAGGYSELREDQFVEAPVKVKSYEGSAYLHVPLPSGDLLANGFTLPEPPQVAEHATEPAEPASVQIRDISGNRGTVIGSNQGPVQTGDGVQVNGSTVHGTVMRDKRSGRK